MQHGDVPAMQRALLRDLGVLAGKTGTELKWCDSGSRGRGYKGAVTSLSPSCPRRRWETTPALCMMSTASHVREQTLTSFH